MKVTFSESEVEVFRIPEYECSWKGVQKAVNCSGCWNICVCRGKTKRNCDRTYKSRKDITYAVYSTPLDFPEVSFEQFQVDFLLVKILFSEKQSRKVERLAKGEKKTLQRP